MRLREFGHTGRWFYGLRSAACGLAFLGLVSLALAQDERATAGEESPTASQEVSGNEVSVAGLISRLGSECWRERTDAMAALFECGEEVLEAVDKAVEDADHEVAWRAERLSWMIRWRVSPRLFRRLGSLGGALMSAHWRDRKRGIRYLESFGGKDALDALRQFALHDENLAVRRHALEASTRLAIRLKDPMAFEAFLLIRSGNQYLKQKQYSEAIKDYLMAISIDADNAVAHYNLACAYSLRGDSGDKELALEALEKALQFGFRDFEHIEKDTDLDAIRNDWRFSRLIEKYSAEQ